MPLKDLKQIMSLTPNNEAGIPNGWMKDALTLIKEIKGLYDSYAGVKGQVAGGQLPVAQSPIDTKPQQQQPPSFLPIAMMLLQKEIEAGKGNEPITVNRILGMIKGVMK